MALVLVVDDEADVRQLLAQAVKRAGHDVMEADCSAAALEVMQARAADVVFTDIQMPGRDGRWLTIELRKRYPLTPVILATSVTDLSPTITLRFGVLSYLIKPFDMKAVLDALATATRWHDEAVASGVQAIEADQLEKWLASLEIA